MAWNEWEAILRMERMAMDLEDRIRRNDRMIVQVREKNREMSIEAPGGGGATQEPPRVPCAPCNLSGTTFDGLYEYYTVAPGLPNPPYTASVSVTLSYVGAPYVLPTGTPSPPFVPNTTGSTAYWDSGVFQVAGDGWNPAYTWHRLILTCGNGQVTLMLENYPDAGAAGARDFGASNGSVDYNQSSTIDPTGFVQSCSPFRAVLLIGSGFLVGPRITVTSP